MSTHPRVTARPLFDGAIVRRAIRDAFGKLDPRRMIRNPVMFVVEIGSLFTTILFIHALATGAGDASPGFIAAISVWLWFTVLFANFAEAMAEGRGKAQADALRKARKDVPAFVLSDARRDARKDEKPSSQLGPGDIVLVEAGQIIPGDGDILEGVASVNESAITGESAPVIRESGGDRSAVTGGSTVLSDWLIVRISARPGESFLDRMIAMVEGARRKKTPNEIALDILLAGLTIVFLLVTVTLYPFGLFAVREMAAAGGTAHTVALTVLVALLVCLIPTTIGGLLSAIGIAGMDRMIQANVIATSGRAVEAAGDVDVLLLDKTGTITHGNRQATALLPASGVTEAQLAEAAVMASLADDTPEGKSIVALGVAKLGRAVHAPDGARPVPFTAQTRMSGVDFNGRALRKGASDAIGRHIANLGDTNLGQSGFVDDKGQLGANPALANRARARIDALRAADPGNTAPVPVDLVTSSGSGLDPHISPAAALYQIARVARARGRPPGAIREIVERCVEPRTLGILGEPRVNVVRLNRALDDKFGPATPNG
jgi:potassium-transporting ATPase ATP-binding subunit